MAKKNKKQSRAASLSETVRANAAQVELRSDFRGYERDFNPDYSDVISDLKRIGTLAGIFLAVLIVLTFIIR